MYDPGFTAAVTASAACSAAVTYGSFLSLMSMPYAMESICLEDMLRHNVSLGLVSRHTDTPVRMIPKSLGVMEDLDKKLVDLSHLSGSKFLDRRDAQLLLKGFPTVPPFRAV